MHKCPKCGKEYEGAFCPECGEKWQDKKNCPNCGAELNGDARFCNGCGYSFYKSKPQSDKKFKSTMSKATALVKAHPNITMAIAIALALVLTIILAICVPSCYDAVQTNGTYYKLKDGEIDQKSYFEINSSKWSDNDGMKGTYKKDGENITFYMEFMGETTDLCSGTISNGILTIIIGGEVSDVYISEKHKHSFDNWEFNDNEHWRVCSSCQQKYEKSEHTDRNNCPVCGYPVKYKLHNYWNDKYYMVIGVNETAENVIIQGSINGLPVTLISSRAFENKSNITSVTIPISVTSIDNDAFRSCIRLADINFNGTKEQWKAIRKSSGWNDSWDYNTGDYTVHCTNGDLSKSES